MASLRWIPGDQPVRRAFAPATMPTMAAPVVNDRPRYSLRQLMMLTTAVAVYFALLGWAIRTADGFHVIYLVAPLSYIGLGGAGHLAFADLRAAKMKSLGDVHATVQSADGLRADSMNLLFQTAVFAVGSVLVPLLFNGFDFSEVPSDAASILQAMLPLVPAMVLGDWLSARRAKITDHGLMSLNDLTPWAEVRCDRDDHGVPVLLGFRQRSRWIRWLSWPRRYAVHTSVQPIVKRLIDEATAAAREREAPAEPAGADRISSAGATPSRGDSPRR